MKKIVPILLLLVGVVTPTYAEKEVADRAIRCSALIYIELTRPEMAGLTAGEALMNRVYAYHMINDKHRPYSSMPHPQLGLPFQVL